MDDGRAATGGRDGGATVVVVGGGLAGLVAARRCAAGGADVTLFESGDRVGGRVRTVERDGYRFDRGFQVLSTAYPAARRELDYGALDLRSFAAGTCVCRPGGRSALVDPLRHPSHAVETLLTPAVTAGDKLRLLRLRASLAGRAVEDAFDAPDDATIREFLVSRGFSDRFLSNVAEPFYGGVTLDRSLETSKRVFEATFAAFARGRTAVPATGMEAIPRHLSDRAREAGVRIETGAEVTRIRAGSDTAVVERGGESIATDAVVVATDPRSARDLTGVASIPTTGVGCTTAHYRLDGPPLSTGRLLLLNAHDAAPNVVAPLSAVAPAYAPEGETLLSATFLDDDRDDGALAATTRDALASWFPERDLSGLEQLHVDRIPFAQFAQPPGTHDGLPGPRAPGGPVYLAGDHTRWSSIQGALASGADAARAVGADLGGD